MWEHWLLNEALPSGWGLKPLPNQAGMRVAIRQCLRVGPRAGALLEDFGVVPDAVHLPTRADVMEGDSMLLARAAELLAAQAARSIKVTMGGPDAANPGKRQITIRTRGLKRLDFFVDDRPQASRDLDGGRGGRSDADALHPHREPVAAHRATPTHGWRARRPIPGTGGLTPAIAVPQRS